MRRTLVAMTTGGINPNKPGCHGNKKLVSPSIMKWFGKNASKDGPMSRLKKSPAKSPRKLTVIMSPRKLPQEMKDGRNLHGIKRKLCTPEKSQSEAKRKCSHGDNGNQGISGSHGNEENLLSPRKPASSPEAGSSKTRVLAPLESPIGNTVGKASRQLFTPDKPGASSQGANNFSTQSPTVNLPNYVLDPKPRTPIVPSGGHLMKENKGKTPDWLTKMRLDRSANKKQGNVTSATNKKEDCNEADSPNPGASLEFRTPRSGTDTSSTHTPSAGGGSSHAVPTTPSGGRAVPTTPSSTRTPRPVKRAASVNKSSKKRVRLSYTILFYCLLLLSIQYNDTDVRTWQISYQKLGVFISEKKRKAVKFQRSERVYIGTLTRKKPRKLCSTYF